MANAPHARASRNGTRRQLPGWRTDAGFAVVTFGCAVLALAAFCPTPPLSAQAPPDTTDRALIELLVGALAAADSDVWPGYRFDRMPLLVYRPDAWAVLVNPPPSLADSPESNGWTEYAAPWPALGRPALLRRESLDGLAGQLAFDHEIGGVKAVAIPLFAEIPPELGQRDSQLLAFLMHEAFHQHQRATFRDVETPVEEAYPILDAENNALAALELHALADALRALRTGDQEAARHRARLAVALHDARWLALDSTARAIERAKEVVEGTAKYVEARSIEAFAHRCRSGALPPLAVCSRFEGEDAAGWLLRDVAARFHGDAIDPEDMPRNRIYPAGAAIGLLLDVVAPGWKLAVQEAGTATGLFERLSAAVAPRDGAPDAAAARARLLAEARERYGWDRALQASRERIDEYLRGFEDALGDFLDRPGTRVVLELPLEGTSRGRSSRERRWVVDGGSRTLGEFVVYTIRRRGNASLSIAIRDNAVLDEVVAGRYRRVTFVLPTAPDLRADGARIPLEGSTEVSFAALVLEGPGVSIEIGAAGRLALDGGAIAIRVEE